MKRLTVMCGMRSIGPAVAIAMLILLAPSDVLARRYALLIAASKCRQQGLPELNFAESDIQRLASLLSVLGYGHDDIVVLRGRSLGERALVRKASSHGETLAPTCEQIKRQLDRLAKKAGKNDVLLVVITGHGVQFAQNGPVYFFPADGALDRRSSMISLDEILTSLRKSRAAINVVLADVCRNAPAVKKTAFPETPPMRSNNATVIYSCSPGEQCFEDPRIQQSVFMHFATEGLRGDADSNDDGRISVEELQHHLEKETPKYVRKRLQKKQTPQRGGANEAAGVLAELPQ